MTNPGARKRDILDEKYRSGYSNIFEIVYGKIFAFKEELEVFMITSWYLKTFISVGLLTDDSYQFLKLMKVLKEKIEDLSHCRDTDTDFESDDATFGVAVAHIIVPKAVLRDRMSISFRVCK